MKKSFSLFLTVIIIGIFSFVALNYFQIKSLKTYNLKNQIVYIQGKNHLDFLKKISKVHDFKDKFEIQNSDFEIYAIKQENKIHYFVKSKKESVNLYAFEELEVN